MATRRETVSLYRAGTFHIRTINVPSRCGDIRPSECGYRVYITAFTDKLNALGFVIRQKEIRDYFDKRYGPNASELSCENIALAAMRYFKRAVGPSRLKSVAVAISPDKAFQRYARAAWERA